MALANVSLSDTFTLWLARFNQLLSIGNAITEGQANTTGTLTISNPNYLNGNVSLNVSNGVVKIQGNTFLSNNIIFTSNSPTLTISGTGRLGTTVYFNVGQLSTDVNDVNTANIASANSVNTAYTRAIIAYEQANTARDQANTARDQGNTAFDSSNTAQYTANLAFDKANTIGGGFFRGNNGDKGQASGKGDLFRINYSFLGSNVGFDDGENALTTGPITINIGNYLIINTGARVVIA